jgi:fumarate reductase subunit D
MKESWLTHNTDKLLLFLLTILLLFFAGHILHHDSDNMQAFEFITGAFSTVLGALVMILTGRISRADNQTGNGQPPTSTIPQPPEHNP